MEREFVLAHELDAAWIIALWLAIHGGDPAPIEISQTAAEAVATSIVAALSPAKGGYIGNANLNLNLGQLQSRMKELNVQVSQGRQAGSQGGVSSSSGGQPGTHAAMQSQSGPSNQLIIPLEYCFQFGGQTYCITINRRPPFKVQSE